MSQLSRPKKGEMALVHDALTEKWVKLEKTAPTCTLTDGTG
eukprot:gene15356-37053_t